MGPETVATVVIVGIIVAAIALYLMAIVAGLTRLRFTVGTIVVGVRAIAHQVRPLNSVVTGIAGDVAEIDDALGRLIAVTTGAPPPASPGSMHDAVAVAKARGEEVRMGVEEITVDDYEEYAGEDEHVDDGAVDYDFEDDQASARSGGGMRQAVAAARERLNV